MITSNAQQAVEEQYEQTLRPQRLIEYIGQEKVKKSILKDKKYAWNQNSRLSKYFPILK